VAERSETVRWSRTGRLARWHRQQGETWRRQVRQTLCSRPGQKRAIPFKEKRVSRKRVSRKEERKTQTGSRVVLALPTYAEGGLFARHANDKEPDGKSRTANRGGAS